MDERYIQFDNSQSVHWRDKLTRNAIQGAIVRLRLSPGQVIAYQSRLIKHYPPWLW